MLPSSSGAAREEVGSEQARLEADLCRLPSVAECAVLAVEGPDGPERIAYVVPGGPFSASTAEIALRAAAPGLTPPGSYVLVTTLPATADGELDLDALRELPFVDDGVAQRLEDEVRGDPRIADVAAFVDDTPDAVPPVPVSMLDPSSRARDVTPSSAVAAAQPERMDSAPEHPAEAAPRPPAETHAAPAAVGPKAASTLTDSLRAAARATAEPHITYLRDDGSIREQTFAELLAEAERVSAGLVDAGVPKGSPVLLQLAKPEELLPVFWGCLLGGFVPANFAVPTSYAAETSELERLRRVFELLEKPYLVSGLALRATMEPFLAKAEAEPRRVLTVDALLASRGAPPSHVADPDEVAFLTFTSGSTGTPKGIMLTHRNILSRGRGTDAVCGNDVTDRVLNWLPFDHIGSISDWHLRCVELRCRMVYCSKEYVLGDPLNWLRVMDRFRITGSWAPNFAYALVNGALASSHETWDLSCVKTLLSAGEAVSSTTVQEFLRKLAPHRLPASALRPAFGMAELGSGVNYFQPTAEIPVRIRHVDRAHLEGPLVPVEAAHPRALGFTSLGPIIPGAGMRIVDDAAAVLPELTIGRLQIFGDPVCRGYYRNPEGNAEVFVGGGWFETGDRGFLSDGELYLTGRNKETLVVNGANFYNGEIETVVEQVEGVLRSFVAACAVRPPESSEERLAVFFAPEFATGRGLALLLREVQNAVAKKTGVKPDYLVPVDPGDIPKTAIGKVQRKQLTKRFESGGFEDAVRRADLLLENDATVPDWFLAAVWRARAAGPPEAAERRAFRILPDEYGLAARVAAELENAGVVSVATTGINGKGDEATGVAPTDLLDLRAFAPGSEDPLNPPPGAGAAVVAERLLSAVAPVLRIAQSGPDPAVRVLVVASHSQAAAPGDRIEPARASVPPVLRALSQEVPGAICRHADVPFATTDDELGRVAAFVAAEALAARADDEVAFRGGLRLVPSFARVTWPSERHGPGLVRGGVYAVTGGLGGVGTALCRYLLENWGARVLILGRREPHPDAADRLRELERLGAVRYGVLDPDAALAWASVEAAEAAFGRPLDGVFHLAGAYREGLVEGEDVEGLVAVLGPKIDGAHAASRLLERRPDAFVVHFSSLASVFSGRGLGAYAAANRYLDAFSLAERARGRKSYSIAWSVWNGLGIGGAGVPLDALRARGYLPMSPARGMASLAGLLGRSPGAFLVGVDVAHRAFLRHSSGAARAVLSVRGAYRLAPPRPGAAAHVEPFELPEVRDRFGVRVPATLWRLASLPATQAGEIDRTKLRDLLRGGSSRARKRPSTPVQERLLAIWQDILGTTAIGVTDNFFDLGGSSLLSVRLFSEIEKKLGASLPPAALFHAATIEALAEMIGEEQPKPRPDSLIPLSGEAGDGGLFLIHDADGRTSQYGDLVERLAATCRVWGLVPYGNENYPALHTRIEDMASYYARKIADAHPAGPLYLAGWGEGGVLAFEVACHLRREGRKVDLVALLDTLEPKVVRRRPFLRPPDLSRLPAALQDPLGTARGARETIARELRGRWKHAIDAARVLLLRRFADRDRTPPWYLQYIPPAAVYRFAEAQYRPSRYDGRILLFRATRSLDGDGDVPALELCRKEDLGWNDRAAGGVEAIDVPGGHRTMLEDPHVQRLAEELARAMSRASASS